MSDSYQKGCWIEPNFEWCFQLVECEDLRLFQQWVLSWQSTGISFEIVPVVGSTKTSEVVEPYLLNNI